MLVQLLASGVAAELAERKLTQVEQELQIGRQIQAGFLPKELPVAPGWELTPHFRPAREVSGDFYDAFALPGEHLALVVADVCTKGVGAALFMALFRSLLRAFAEQAVDRGPDSIARSAVELTNGYVYQTHGWQCMFCTVFFGVLDLAGGALTYINAGHDAPALLGRSGIKTRLNPTGPSVGWLPSPTFNVEHVVVEPGEIVFAYSDGVTEARDPAGQFFTEKRLLSILERSSPSAEALVGNVRADLDRHIAGAEPYDDVTMLAVRRAL
jgi:sigma-B regulation protein RsbU (phosphoserine phosphatase)